jgi:hypothetical protein
MLKRVYIETSIPSFHYTARTDTESLSRMHWTRRWWSECAPRYWLTTSAAVIEELLAGTSEYTQDRLALVRPLELVDISEEVRQVTRMYIRRLVMPNDPTGDALHLAVASVHKVDVLLTWNCRHLANPNKFDHIRTVNSELGLATPILTTPVNFLSGEEHHG